MPKQKKKSPAREKCNRKSSIFHIEAKLFEFISLEHTAKNVMITARKTGKPNQDSKLALERLKDKFKLPDFYLDRALAT